MAGLSRTVAYNETTPVALAAQARELVADLHAARPRIFWTDLLVSAAVGWSSFAVAVAAPRGPVTYVAGLIAMFALYRGICFMHELTHLRPRALAGFETAWNLLLGLPLLMPSTMYVGVHQDHHKLATYGTDADPEYLPFARSRASVILFTAQALVLPALLVVRHVVAVPLELVSHRLHRLLATHASSLSMNRRYRRTVSPALSRKMRTLNAAACALWAGAVALAAAGWLPWRTFLIWYLVMAAASLVNTLRTLGAHEYESSGEPMTRGEQLLDSIDTPGSLVTALWAPVGLRYHAVHHFFPGIPYHNLGEAYRRLATALPDYYQRCTSAGLLPSLVKLWASTVRNRNTRCATWPAAVEHGSSTARTR